MEKENYIAVARKGLLSLIKNKQLRLHCQKQEKPELTFQKKESEMNTLNKVPDNTSVFIRRPVYITKEYERFKLLGIGKNRKIRLNHVEEIAEALKQSNFLINNPIKVNKDFYILDGQHRYLAAKKENLEIYYEIHSSLGMDEIIKENAGTLKWVSEDYLDYYVSINKEAYLIIKNVLDRWPKIKLSVVMLILTNTEGRNIWKRFKNGEIELNKNINEKYIKDMMLYLSYIINFVNDNLLKYKQIASTQMFQQAVVLFMKRPNVCPEKFLKKLNYKVLAIHPCTKIKEYIDIFLHIYNFKESKKISG